ncbi:hypothetical protein F2Q69_00055268 [Brassica cretica]|uniref:Uncharacterized protein n=1 Tax=Brassica cretica TaxID=69181 RepID=A0A8S9N7E5_BRACR|nr:hypothetical protein F2Q69_00055268 [Brassica cretica]
MDFVVVSDRTFGGWQSPAGTSPEQLQIATMKEKSSHHSKREIRVQQTRFGGTEERSIKYESDPRTVNFISVLPLIQKNQKTSEISLESLDAIFSDHLSDRQIDVRGIGAACVYDQPGDEATLVKQMVSDRSNIGVSG